MHLSISLFLSFIQCLCACHITPGPATNWVSPSFSFLSLNASSHTLPPSSPPTSLHRCLSVALSTAWSVPLSAGCMVVISKAACNQWEGGWGGGGWMGWLLYLRYSYQLMLEESFSVVTVSLISDSGFK